VSGHISPHFPQFAGSVANVTHAPLQLAVPLLQLERQVPPLQTWLAPQARAQAPQWLGSFAVLTHAPEHSA
jgi:hypothetical protein